MKCPVCKEPDLVMAERQGIEIDYCPSCRGVWLDRGELDKIVERAAQECDPREQDRRQGGDDYERDHRRDDDDRRYYEHDKHYHEHKKRRRWSWLGEIFD